MRFAKAILILGLVLALFAADLPAERSSAGSACRMCERTFDLVYRFAVLEVPSDAKHIAAWVPIPPSNRHQRVKGFSIERDWPYTILVEPEYGNAFLRFDLSGSAPASGSEPEVAMTFRIKRKCCRVLDSETAAGSSPEKSLERFLAPDSLIPIDGKIGEEARRAKTGRNRKLSSVDSTKTV